MRLRVQSLALLSGLRIWWCPELWCRLQMWLGSGVTVAVVWVCSCSSDLTLNLGMSVCCGCGPTKQKKKKKRKCFLPSNALFADTSLFHTLITHINSWTINYANARDSCCITRAYTSLLILEVKASVHLAR